MDREITCNFDLPPSREDTYTEKYDARQRLFGRNDVTPLWVADMDLPAPGFLTKALQQRISHPLYGYTEQYDAVFTAIQWWLQDQHGVEIDREAILLSPSVVTSMCLAIQAYTEPGDSVALLSPVYGPFFTTVTSNGRSVADCPLVVRESRHHIDFNHLENTLAQPAVKLLLFCNPHNPGGRVWTVDELEQVANLCAANGVVLFSDEIHSDIVYPPQRHTSILSVAGAQPHTIQAHSIGKTFNASGLQASFCSIADPNLRQPFRQVQNAVHAGDINLLGKTAIASALSPEGAEYKRQLVAYLQENTRAVCRRMGAISGVAVMKPESTFLVWCDFRSHGPWQEVFRRLIKNAGVALSGGKFFGPAGAGWFRINCAHPRSQLYPAIDRIASEFNA
jgi:cystathionine beta-lyase